MELANAALVRLKDAVWACAATGCAPPRAVGDLAGRDAGRAAIAAMASVQVALSALDRLEVRGRDSAGLHLMVWDHGVDVAAPAMRALWEQRYDPLFGSGFGARRTTASCSFVYKAAAEIGELGDNTRPCVRPIAMTSCCGSRCRRRTAQATVLAPHPLGLRRA